MAELMRCYRHPDRETGVSCSECGRPICPDCMTFGPVGIRCPDHSGKARGAAKVVQNVQRSTSRNPDPRDDDVDRDQRRHLPAAARWWRLDQRQLGLDLRARRARHEGDRRQRPARRPRRGRVVASAHGGIPPLRPHPPRLEHARALVDRPAARGLPRVRAVPPALSRLRPRWVGRGADRDPQRHHRRRVRRDLRDPRRGDRARAPGDLRARRQRAQPPHRQPRLYLRRAGHLDRRPSRRRHRRRALDPRALTVRQGKRGLQPDRPALDRQPRRDRRRQRRRRVLEGEGLH